MAVLPPEAQTAIDRTVESLKSTLQQNLASCVLYGSAVRGSFVPGVSDLNLMIVLNESTPEAHAAIADAIRGPIPIETLVLGRDGVERSVQSFLLKFLSIRRNYRLLHGDDPLAAIRIDQDLLRFLCEQSLRNRRLRLVHASIKQSHDPRRYTRYVVEQLPGIFTDIGEVLRCSGHNISTSYADRIATFQRLLDVDASVLSSLLELKREPRTLSPLEVSDLHARLFALLNHAVKWAEAKWPQAIAVKS